MSAEDPGRAVPGPTPSQTVGPFFGFALPFAGGGHPAPAHRTAITLHGTVLDGAGEPVPDALLEFWQADPDGSLRGAPGSLSRGGATGFTGMTGSSGFTDFTDFTGFARVATDAAGHWVVRTLAPGVPSPPAGSVPGPRTARGGVRSAPYLAVAVFARGLMHHLHTRAYLPSDQEALRRDPLLASLDETRRRTLIARAEPDGALRFDIRLQGDAGATVAREEETVFLEFG